MTDFAEELLATRLKALANTVDDSDWADVERRARTRPFGARRPIVLAAAAIFVALAVGGTLAATLSSQAPPSTPGPRKVDRVLPHGTIAWLFRHEPRGQSLSAAQITLGSLVGSQWQPVRFARVLRPEPNGRVRVVVSLIGKRGRNICVTTFRGHRALGGGCAFGWRLSAFKATLFGDQQFVLFSGLASDSVARMSLFLADGSRVTVPLQDNAFAIQVPRARFPGNLVAYDSRGRVIGIDPWKRPFPALR